MPEPDRWPAIIEAVRHRSRCLSTVLLTASLVGCSSGRSHPSGWKAVDYQKVRVYVPAAWPVRSKVSAQSLVCGGVGRVPPPVVLLVDPSEYDLEGYACALQGGPAGSETTGTVVMAATKLVAPPAADAKRWSARTVHGLQMSVASSQGPQPAMTVVIGERHVVMVVLAPSDLAERIVSTLR